MAVPPLPGPSPSPTPMPTVAQRLRSWITDCQNEIDSDGDIANATIVRDGCQELLDQLES